MSLKANDQVGGGSGGNIEKLEPGTYPARVVQVVDLGLQAQPPYKGEEKPPINMLGVTYEFVDEFMKDEDGNDLEDKPRHLTEMFTFHNLTSDRAKSTKRYKALDPSQTYGGDWSQLINTPCNVTIVLNPGKGKNEGKVFENIAEVTAMREKDVKRCPELVNKAIVFDLDDPSIEDFNALPEFIQRKIKSNLNYEGSKLQELGAGEPGATQKPAEPADTSEDHDENENPF